MAEQPLEPILDRTWYPDQVDKYFSRNLILLQEMANYGSNLIPRCFESSNRKLEDIVIIVSLFKYAVTLLDAIEVQLRRSVVSAAFVTIRAFWEVELYLEWILRADTERRARLYFVHDVRHQLAWERTALPGTPESVAFAQATTDAPSPLDAVKYEPVARKNITLLTKKLATPECAAINAEFDNLRGRRTRDVDWYAPAGASNIRGLAQDVGREAEYEVMYRGLCRSAHGTVFREQVRFDKDHVVYEPIREFIRIEEAIRFSCIFALRTFKLLLAHYRPDELENLSRKYATEWQTRFNIMSHVVYRNGTLTIHYPKYGPRDGDHGGAA